MDPNATLEELRNLASLAADQHGGDPDADYLAARMAELFQALDEWLSKGGFAPAAWKGRLV